MSMFNKQPMTREIAVETLRQFLPKGTVCVTKEEPSNGMCMVYVRFAGRKQTGTNSFGRPTYTPHTFESRTTNHLPGFLTAVEGIARAWDESGLWEFCEPASVADRRRAAAKALQLQYEDEKNHPRAKRVRVMRRHVWH